MNSFDPAALILNLLRHAVAWRPGPPIPMQSNSSHFPPSSVVTLPLGKLGVVPIDNDKPTTEVIKKEKKKSAARKRREKRELHSCTPTLQSDPKGQLSSCLFGTNSPMIRGPTISCTKTKTLPNLRLPISSACDPIKPAF